MEAGGYVGLLAFCSFVFSVIAAVLAIDLYALLRTGRSGSTWRVLIIASVMFALMHALRLAELLNFGGLRLTHLSEIVELMFVMALAYAFYLQRQIFGRREQSLPNAPHAIATSTETNNAPTEPSKAPRPDAHPMSRGTEPEPPINSALEQEDEDAEDEEAASEWARLSGQSDVAVSRRERRAVE